MQRLSAELGVPHNTIFPTIGYIQERQSVPAIDRYVLNVLYVAAKIIADQNSTIL